jgi:acylphosphatase
MMKLTAFVSGKVQEVGYRARIVDIANAFGLKGMVENPKDGRVKIIAEGDDEKLKWFASAIDIKNTSIHVSSIEKQYSPASNEFDNFGKLVLKGEVETWLDIAPVYFKEIVFTLKKMNDNLGGKRNQMICKQDELLLTTEVTEPLRSSLENSGER